MDKKQPFYSPGQMVWGIALALMGCGVFFRIPEVMPRVAQIQSLAGMTLWVRICFYLMGIILLAGGVQKIRRQAALLRDARRERPPDRDSDEP